MSVEILHVWKNTSLASSSVTINVGAIVKNTTLIAIIVKSGTIATTSQPAGWVQVHSASFSSCRFEVWKKKATSTEPASYIWGGDSQDYIISIHELHRADFNSAAIVSAGFGNSITPSSPEIINATAESMSLMLSGYVTGTGAGSLTLNADHTETVNEIQANVSMLAGHRNFHKIYFTEDSSAPIDTTPENVYGLGLSEDGLDLVAGIPEGGAGDNYRYGLIKSYHRNSITSNWSKSSNDMENAPEGVDGMGLGRDISLSTDGLIMSCGTNAHAGKVFYWKRTSPTNNWVYVNHLTLFGRDIDYGFPLYTSDADASFSTNLVMSSDGLHLSGTLYFAEAPMPSYILGDTQSFKGTLASFSRPDIDSKFIIDSANDIFYWDAKVTYEYPALSNETPTFAKDNIGLSEDKRTLLGCSSDFGRETGKTRSGIQTLFRLDESSKWLPIHHQQYATGSTLGGQSAALNSTGLSFIRAQNYYDQGDSSGTMIVSFFTRKNNIALWDEVNTFNIQYAPVIPDHTSQARRIAVSGSGNSFVISHLDNLTRSFIHSIPAIGHSVDISVDWAAFFLTVNEDTTYAQVVSNVPAGQILISGSAVGGNPVANQDDYEVDHDKTLVVPAIGVLSNDEYIP